MFFIISEKHIMPMVVWFDRWMQLAWSCLSIVETLIVLAVCMNNSMFFKLWRMYGLQTKKRDILNCWCWQSISKKTWPFKMTYTFLSIEMQSTILLQRTLVWMWVELHKHQWCNILQNSFPFQCTLLNMYNVDTWNIYFLHLVCITETTTATTVLTTSK